MQQNHPEGADKEAETEPVSKPQVPMDLVTKDTG